MNYKISTVIFIVLTNILFSQCTSSDKAKNKEQNTSESIDKAVETVEPTIENDSNLKSSEEVNEYLNESGFIVSMNGKEIIREDQMAEADPNDISKSISVLKNDPEANKMKIFYLKVAGSALDDKSSSEDFIKNEILSDKNYLDQVDRMVKFLQRQDRPTIKKALLSTIGLMTNDQCLEYLQLTGYLTGTAASSFQYNAKALKPIPMFVKLAIVDKLKRANDERGSMVYDQLALDLGINS